MKLYEVKLEIAGVIKTVTVEATDEDHAGFQAMEFVPNQPAPGILSIKELIPIDRKP